MQRRRVIISLSFLLAAVMLANSLYSKAVPQGSALPPSTNIRMSSSVLVGVCLYYAVCKLACLYKGCQPLARQGRGGRGAESRYQDVREGTQARTEIHRGAPRLTMQHVWVLVYGLGGVLFVTSFCLLSLHPVGCASLSAGLHVVAIVEMSKNPDSLTCGRVCTRVLVLMFALLSSMLSTLAHWELHDEALTLSYAFYYVLLPVLAPLVLTLVKAQTDYSVGLVTETCEFGVPFAFILAAQYLLASSTGDLVTPHPHGGSPPYVFHQRNSTLHHLSLVATQPLPGTTLPGTPPPGTTLPGTPPPGTTLPGTAQPGTTQPGTTLPGTTPSPTPLNATAVSTNSTNSTNSSGRRRQEPEDPGLLPAGPWGLTGADMVMLFVEPAFMGTALVLFVASVMHSRVLDNIVIVTLAVGSRMLFTGLAQAADDSKDYPGSSIASFVMACLAFVTHLVTTLDDADAGDTAMHDTYVTEEDEVVRV